MSAIPYMPLYIADYMADAAHLSTLEHGAYMLLIMTYWQRGKPLPNSNERLANVARMSNEQWLSVRTTIAEFFHDDGETWTHKRIESELARFLDKSEKARAAGKASAQQRLSKRSTSVQQTFNHTDTDTDKYINTEEPAKTNVLPISPKPEKKKKSTSIPIDFHVTEELRNWATGKGINNIDSHLEPFITTCKAKGYAYVDWTCAFQKAVRDDWAKIGHGAQTQRRFVPA